MAWAFKLHSTAIPRLREIVANIAIAARKMLSKMLAFSYQKTEQTFLKQFTNQYVFGKYRGFFLIRKPLIIRRNGGEGGIRTR